MHYLITGGACRGKTTLALWLCGRLPRPMAGLRTLCTGRCAAGPRFSLQDLATGRQEPLDRETATVQDLWSLSDAGGVSAGAIFRALDQCVRSDAEGVGDLH